MATFEFSFDDEHIDTFYYDNVNNKIALSFGGYYNNVEQLYHEVNCSFVIENWRKARSKKEGETKLHDLDVHMGIFSLILSMELKENILELYVMTLDGRYIYLYFEDCNCRFDVE